ncbi:hypothetical protein H4219_002491 [Mycoemilia scoparia]|uniref:Fungal lipase-type domain-containing protein n=1 Tax=Mycoemilia scoparia TaxID=417184 RepID=A0A9W8A126_9FUNG|nr:hypothetical protein H4219_002491 [Mycoemilia scoparia]
MLAGFFGAVSSHLLIALVATSLVVTPTNVYAASASSQGLVNLQKTIESYVNSINGTQNLDLPLKNKSLPSSKKPVGSSRQSDQATVVNFNQDQLNNIIAAAYFSDATYADNSDISNWTCGTACSNPLVTGTNVTLVWNDQNPSTKGYIAKNDARRVILIAFEGSDTAESWLDNLQVELVRFPLRSTGSATWGRAHEGFSEAASLPYSEYKDQFVALANENPGYDVLVTGHSRGAAIGQLFVALLANEYPELKPRLNMITFGQPRVGNEDLAQYINRQGIKTALRVVDQSDIVPHLPPEFLGYRHPNRELWIRERPRDKYELVLCALSTTDAGSGCPQAGQLDVVVNGVRDHSIDNYIKYLMEIPISN